MTELLASAERAFVSGDDQAAVDFCSRILAQKAGFPPALSLLARAEARRWDSRLREVLQQAEKEMALGELTSAKATLARAREIDPSSPRIRAVEEKLEAALAAQAAALERAERARIEQLKPVPAAPPPRAPSAIDLDADAVTRPLLRAPIERPPLGSLSKPPLFSPPPAPPMPPPAPPVPPPAPGMPSAAPPSGAIRTTSSVRRRRIAKPDSQDTSFAVAGPIVPPELIGGVPPRGPAPAPQRRAAGGHPAIARQRRPAGGHASARQRRAASGHPPPSPGSGAPPAATPPSSRQRLAAKRHPAAARQRRAAKGDPAAGRSSRRNADSYVRPACGRRCRHPPRRRCVPADQRPAFHARESPLAGDSPTRRVDSRSVQRAIAQSARPVPSAVRQAKPRAWTPLWLVALAVPLLAIAVYVAIPGRPAAPADPPATQVAPSPAPPAPSANPPAAAPRGRRLTRLLPPRGPWAAPTNGRSAASSTPTWRRCPLATSAKSRKCGISTRRSAKAFARNSRPSDRSEWPSPARHASRSMARGLASRQRCDTTWSDPTGNAIRPTCQPRCT